jgi:hypothetical protein
MSTRKCENAQKKVALCDAQMANAPARSQSVGAAVPPSQMQSLSKKKAYACTHAFFLGEVHSLRHCLHMIAPLDNRDGNHMCAS